MVFLNTMLPVADKQSLFQLIAKHSDQIRSFGVRSIGVFGSFVRNTMTDTSDVDVLVDFDPERKTFNNYCDLAYFLEDLSGRKVDVVTPRS